MATTRGYYDFYVNKLDDDDVFEANDYVKRFNKYFEGIDAISIYNLKKHYETNEYFYVVKEGFTIYLYKATHYYWQYGQLHRIQNWIQFT